jgi:protein-S-isoprenylcysteine O-methyltransferase Ste14
VEAENAGGVVRPMPSPSRVGGSRVRSCRRRGTRKPGTRSDRLDRPYNRSKDDGGTVGLRGSGGDQNTNQYYQRSTRGNSSPSWRWDNIPLPEPHVAGILTSGVLHLTRPWRLPGSRRLYGSAGWTLAGIGIAISALAVRAASDVALERSSTLISTGPYALSRNPMYIGWTLLYLGAVLATRNAWMVASLPIVVSLVHREVLREEQILEQAFGEEYLRYQKLVPRYL